MVSRRDCIRGCIAGAGWLCIPSAVFDIAKAAPTPPGAVAQPGPRPPTAPPHYIDGDLIALNQSLIPASCDVIVRADTVALSGLISLKGFNLTIISRVLTVAAGAAISTAALPAQPDYTGRRAQPGTDVGAAGQPGQNGGDGLPGGNVFILAGTVSGALVIDASGAAGGGAESGGNGAMGRNGPDWSQPLPRGGDGQRGGAAGNAGKAGNGGNGGAVTVYVLYDKVAPAKARIKSAPGAAGALGSAGQPGGGGNPGKGGSFNTEIYFPCYMNDPSAGF